MAIVNGSPLGTAFPGNPAATSPLKAVSFVPGGQLYVAQVKQTFPTQYIIRGRQILLDANVEQGYSSRISTIEEADLTVLAESPDGNGFNNPTGFSTPNGWVAKPTADGSTTFIENVDEAKQAAGGDADGDGIPDTDRSAPELFKDPIGWAKANPWWVVGGLVLVFILVRKPKGRGKKSILAGLLGQ